MNLWCLKTVVADRRGKISSRPLQMRQGWRNSALSLRSTLLANLSTYISTCTPHLAHFTMVKAIRGEPDLLCLLPRYQCMAGTLVRCDASIKAMLVDIDSKNNNEYIIEELDEEHILVKETKINELKGRLNNVSVLSSVD